MLVCHALAAYGYLVRVVPLSGTFLFRGAFYYLLRCYTLGTRPLYYPSWFVHLLILELRDQRLILWSCICLRNIGNSIDREGIH